MEEIDTFKRGLSVNTGVLTVWDTGEVRVGEREKEGMSRSVGQPRGQEEDEKIDKKS